MNTLNRASRAAYSSRNGGGGIGAAVVHTENLQVAVCLAKDALQAFAEVFFDIVDRHNDGDERRIRHIRRMEFE